MSQKFYQEQEELKHFGVLGMHWGQRKARSVSTTTAKSTRIISRHFRPNLVTKTTTIKTIKNPTKKEIKAFLDERRKQRIAALKIGAIQIAAITAMVSTIKVIDLISRKLG